MTQKSARSRARPSYVRDFTVLLGTAWLGLTALPACDDEAAAADGPFVDAAQDHADAGDSASNDPPNSGPGPSSACKPASQAPGEPAYTADVAGSGACAGTSLAAAIDAVHVAHPELADIDTIYDPRGGIADGSYIYAFLRPDGGFDLVFKRGGGDCPAGCTENDYFYFASDDMCKVQSMGQAVQSDEGCYPSDAVARWGIPERIYELARCGVSNAPQPLPTSSALTACGFTEACGVAPGPTTPLSSVTLSILQDVSDPSQATVRIGGTSTDLDGKSWPATVTHRKVHAFSQTFSEPPACYASTDFTFDYDFETGSGSLSYLVSNAVDCDAGDTSYCKGGVDAQLVAASDTTVSP